MQKFTFNFQNGHKIIQKIGLIDEFKGKWSQQVSTDLPLEKLRILALSDNSSASVRLEKPTASANDVQRNMYRNASNIVLNQSTLFSHETIKHTYECLEPQVTDNNFDKYRKQTSKLTLFITNQPISFRSMPTRNIDQQLKQEVDKTITYLDGKQLHPLIVIADFLYEFIAICPFATCNLQLSRLIAQQLLCQLNYNFIEYLAFEAAFEARKEQYHVSLSKALNSRNQVKEDISEWILFFLECIELAINHLEHRLKPLLAALKTLNTENFVLNEVQLEKPIKKQDIVAAAKTSKSKNEKSVEIAATKVGGNKPEKIVEKPIIKKQNETIVEKPIIKKQNETIVELPLSQLFENDTIKFIDNQSIKSVERDTTTDDEPDLDPIELNEMVDNPMKSENDLSKSEVYLSPRQKKLKKFIMERQPTRLSDLKKAFPEINQHVIKKDLQYMHRLNTIQKIGDFKTTVYIVNT